MLPRGDSGREKRVTRIAKIKGEMDEKQKKLTDIKEGNRKEGEKEKEKVRERKGVTFVEEREVGTKDVRRMEDMEKEIKEIRNEMNRKAEETEEKKKKERIWEARLRIIEENIDVIGKEVKEIREKIERWEKDRSEGEWEAESNTSISRSRRSSSRGGSIYTSISEDRLSMREVGKIKKLISDKEKEERKNNIAIKGMGYVGDIRLLKEKVQEFLKEDLEIECKIESCRMSGKVIIAKLGDEEIKREVMRRKYKLKGGTIFIENDLSWEERKIQERLNRWAKDYKARGKQVKIGLGKMKINGLWKNWVDIEREMEGKNEGRNRAEGESNKEVDRENFV
jgi:hypothetical protein